MLVLLVCMLAAPAGVTQRVSFQEKQILTYRAVIGVLSDGKGEQGRWKSWSGRLRFIPADFCGKL
jgi:hypothetical protein